jgi:hypothetical protein
MIKTQKLMYNMFFVHLKAYLNVTVDFAAHRIVQKLEILNRTATNRIAPRRAVLEPHRVTVWMRRVAS